MTGVPWLPVMHPLLSRQPCTLLVGAGSDGLVVATRPRLRDRLAARWRSGALDRALARGTPPEASRALALRAQHLTEPEQRRSIAQGLRGILREAHERRPVISGRVMPNRSSVTAARDELTLLADALDEPGPVAAGGVAQAALLLTDGTGPLYSPFSAKRLGAGAARATRELRPWPA
jgi:hypothetical protein